MFKNLLLLCVTMLGIGTVFGGEFKYSEYHKLVVSKDIVGMKSYLASNNEVKNNVSHRANFILANVWLKHFTGEKQLTAETAYAIFTEGVDQFAGLTTIEKVAIKCNLLRRSIHVLKRLNINNAAIKAYKQEIFSKFYTPENLDIVVNNCVLKSDVWWFYSLNPDFGKVAEKAAPYDPYNTFVKAIPLADVTVEGKKHIIQTLANNVTTAIKNPTHLDYVVKRIKQLSDPIYDTEIKNLLIVLNRHCYPKIQTTDQWKKSVVALQLVMKTYGL